MVNKIFSWLMSHKEVVVLLGCTVLFLLLIFKDPFSERTLIPNFEPHPDTFNYINPALSFVRGEGFRMGREERALLLNVPPLYSFTLVPAFILNPDPRTAYYANVFLAIFSLLLFWLILKRVIKNQWIIYLLLTLYITNFFLYWVPSLIMAENLTLTLFLIAFFFLTNKTTMLNTVIIAFVAIGLYATKYANIPTTSAVIILFLFKLFSEKLILKQKLKSAFIFISALIFFLLMLGIFEGYTKGNNIFSQIFEHLVSIYSSVPKIESADSQASPKATWFGVQYISQNLPLYLKSLAGSPNRFLWDQTPLIPQFVGLFGLIGIMMGLFYKRGRFISLALLLFICSSIMFMSIFYSFDTRYVYIIIPILLIGFGLLLKKIEEKVRKKAFFVFAVVIILIIYLATNFIRIKSQISLNLKYAETPWHYIAVLKMNEYFTNDKVVNGKKPILISAEPPFLIDYYSNGNYTLLPLSYEQEFRGIKEIVWGPNDYSDLPKLYTQYLKEGYNVYVSRSGLGNEGYTNRDFNIIINEFETKLVLSGCYDQCNIYSVRLK